MIANSSAVLLAEFEKFKAVNQNSELMVWVPNLFAFNQIIISGDLEVRARALSYLFEMLKANAPSFTQEFLALVIRGILFPLFADLKNGKIEDQDLLFVSTTLVQAVREVLNLFGAFFPLLKEFIEELVDLLITCMIQENDALSKCGADGLVTFIETNISNFSDDIWDMLCLRLCDLFEVTSPVQLYFDVSIEQGGEGSGVNPFGKPFSSKPKRNEFRNIITRCVLHLHVVDTVFKILNCGKKKDVYESMSSRHLFRIGDALYLSYLFAKHFNADLPLRTELLKMGFMKQLPNLLNQETSSVAAYLTILAQMYLDSSRQNMQEQVEHRLIPYLGLI